MFNEIIKAELVLTSSDLLHLQFRTNCILYYHLHIFTNAYTAVIVTGLQVYEETLPLALGYIPRHADRDRDTPFTTAHNCRSLYSTQILCSCDQT